jgi:7,8-dihydro-6-hydroxymethylpterin dimethyltransferase
MPAWAPGLLPKSWERSAPGLGVPRQTQSLCPRCNKEAVDSVLEGRSTIGDFRDRPGVIDAQILEDAGCIVMKKTCEKHGTFKDVLSTNPDFFRRTESLYVGQDFRCRGAQSLHDHGPSSIRTGRGVTLIVDLTNRCNLKCSPCYMDANHATYVHELSMNDVKSIFHRALSVTPKREMIVLFAGGEPTIADVFLEAVSYARSLGFKRIHVATNGIRFAQDPEFVAQARAAGLHQVYLQIDGASNRANQHRGATNLFDVKRRALENISRVGMRVSLQVAVVKTVNNHSLGDIVRFAIEHIDKIQNILFQPIMFTGRDAEICDQERAARRYTFADLAEDLLRQTSIGWEPMRDWFPMSAYSVFANLFDSLNPNAAMGSMYADVHPDHGIFSPLLVNRATRQAVPISSFLNVERILADIVRITDHNRGKIITKAQLIFSVLRNFDSRRAPKGFSRSDFKYLFESFSPRLRCDIQDWESRDNTDPEWRILYLSGMWFQDLFNYDFDAIRMDATPVATQEGEISFSAYNAAGWRKIVEHLHKTATLPEWHTTQGRHEIFANGALVNIESTAEHVGDLVAV